MDQLEQQKAILELGKLLVKELDLEESVDTLSRWMAHYVAEKIKQAEELPVGVKKTNVEKECFSLILELWKHRWHYKPDRQPLRNFNQLFDILEGLNPEKEKPYFFRYGNTNLSEDDDSSFEPADLEKVSPLAVQIEKVARIWINYLLREAAAKAQDEKTQEIINRAIKLPDSTDARIIRIVYKLSEDIDEQPVDQEELARKGAIETLNRRIGELQKFKKINEYLIGQFEKELNTLKK